MKSSLSTLFGSYRKFEYDTSNPIFQADATTITVNHSLFECAARTQYTESNSDFLLKRYAFQFSFSDQGCTAGTIVPHLIDYDASIPAGSSFAFIHRDIVSNKCLPDSKYNKLCVSVYVCLYV